MPAPRVLLVPLAAEGGGPWDGVLGRRLIARLARSLRAADVPVHAEVHVLSRGGESAFVVGSEAPSDDALRAAAQEVGAEWCVGGSVAVTEAGTQPSSAEQEAPPDPPDPAAPPACRLSLRLVPAEGQAVSTHGGDALDGESLLDAMRAALVELYDKLGINRGARHRPDQALGAFAQLHEIDPTDGEAALGAGRCLALLGELSDARRLLQLASAVVESDSPTEREALLLLRRVEADLSESS